jgi:TonB family protein
MKISLLRSAFFIVCLLVIGGFSGTAYSQDLSFNYNYKLFMENADEAPRITGIDDVVLPEAARKNGVTGRVKADLVLGENAKTRDIVVTEGLSHGVTEAVTKILQTLYFEPARLKGKPVSSKMQFEFVITALYSENDKNVAKAKVLSKLEAPYPSDYKGEKVKGKVSVMVLFMEDGFLKIMGVSSTMPREFDRAAAEAAKNIKFTPAVHKKSKKNVSQQLTVEFEFK